LSLVICHLSAHIFQSFRQRANAKFFNSKGDYSTRRRSLPIGGDPVGPVFYYVLIAAVQPRQQAIAGVLGIRSTMVGVPLPCVHDFFYPGISPMHGCRQSIACHCLAIVLACWCVDSARGQAFGPWHIPSTPMQFFGHSFGGGHHAPMVHTVGGNTPRVPRMTFMPPRGQSAYAPSCAACSFTGHNSAASCNNGLFAPHVAPSHHYQHQHRPTFQHQRAMQPTPTLVAPQHVFAPLTKPALKILQPAAKPKVQPRLPAKTPGPQKSLMQPPASEPQRGTLPEASMPKADPLAEPDDRQAWLDF